MYHWVILDYRLYYARADYIIIILKGVDTHYTVLQSQAMLRDVLPLFLIFDNDNRLQGLSFGPHVSLLHAMLSIIRFLYYFLNLTVLPVARVFVP